MSTGAANQGRWRSGVSARRAAAIEEEYGAALERLEAAGASFAPLLRRTFERSRSATPDDFAALPYLGVELEKVATA